MTDMSFSPIAAGLWRLSSWNMDAGALVHWIEQALDLGITTFDHADIYGGYSAEGLFGTALQRAPHLRQRMQLVTKCGIKLVSPQRPTHRFKSYDSSRLHIKASVDASLSALQTDHIDLLLLHRPDLLMNPDEVADTFAQLRSSGKVLHFGVSNHTPGQFAQVHRRLPLVTNQIEFSPLQMQALADGTLEQCTDLAVRPMVWSPLAGGRLFSNPDAQAQRVRAVLDELAQQHGVSAATVAYAWILRHPSNPVPVAGSGRIEALREAWAALSIELSAEDWYRVWQASMGHDIA
jgi:predicted oxidoreductase